MILYSTAILKLMKSNSDSASHLGSSSAASATIAKEVLARQTMRYNQFSADECILFDHHFAALSGAGPLPTRQMNPGSWS
jgi:hypothetical protein